MIDRNVVFFVNFGLRSGVKKVGFFAVYNGILIGPAEFSPRSRARAYIGARAGSIAARERGCSIAARERADSIIAREHTRV